MAKKKGFMSRLIEGPERSENYARSTLPSNRWQLGWDILKTNFSKIVLLNLILVLTALPIVLIFFLRSGFIKVESQNYPFDSFMAYPYIGTLGGAAESVIIRANSSTLIFLPIAAIILAFGLSGVLYIIRNMVWTEGVFVGSDFWRGVKKNFFIVMWILLAYSVFMVLGLMSIAFSDFLINTNQSNAVLMYIAKIITIISMVFLTMVAMHMLTMSVTYELGFFKLLRNAFILTVSLLPANIFFAAFALINYLVSLIIPMIGGIMFVILGLALGVLIWSVYSHWIYDKFINEKVPGAKRNRGIYEKTNAQTFGDDLADIASQQFDTVYLNKRPVKPVTDYDVEIVELPTSFNREDLRRLEESKKAMREDSDKYVEDVLSGKIKQESILDKFKDNGGDGEGETEQEAPENTQESTDNE